MSRRQLGFNEGQGLAAVGLKPKLESTVKARPVEDSKPPAILSQNPKPETQAAGYCSNPLRTLIGLYNPGFLSSPFMIRVPFFLLIIWC